MSRTLAVLILAAITIIGALAGRLLTRWLRRREQATHTARRSADYGGEMPGAEADGPAASRAPESATCEATGARDVSHIHPAMTLPLPEMLGPRALDRIYEAVWTLPITAFTRCVYIHDDPAPHAASRLTLAGPMCASHAAWYMTDTPHRTVRS